MDDIIHDTDGESYDSEDYAPHNNSDQFYVHSTEESDNTEEEIQDESFSQATYKNQKKKRSVRNVIETSSSDISSGVVEEDLQNHISGSSGDSKSILEEKTNHDRLSLRRKDISAEYSNETDLSESVENSKSEIPDISTEFSSDEHEMHFKNKSNRLSNKDEAVIEDVSSDEKSIVLIESNSILDGRNSAEPDVAMSLAQQEVGAGSVDPIVAQKRAFLVCKLQQLENQLTQTKLLLSAANIDMLPDKGEKLKESVISQEKEVEIVKTELKKTALVTPQKKEFFSLSPSKFAKVPSSDNNKPLGKKAKETEDRELALTVERLKNLHSSLVTAPSEEDKAEDPSGLKVKLMPHQQHALAWLSWREQQKPAGGVLADDMGLGKTLTMIALVMATLDKDDVNYESDNDSDEESNNKKLRYRGGTLVVCPASLLSQWEAEVKNRCKRGTLSVEVYHSKRRESVPKFLARNDIVITTYNTLTQEFKTNATVYKIHWKRVILDEAHVVRNHKTQASAAVCALVASKRWALTGTPIQNKEMDLYAILKFLKCSPFNDLRVWKRWVDNKNASGQHRLAAIMKTLMLRRTKQELQAKGALECLPDKCIEVIKVALDQPEQLVYQKVLVYSRTLFAQFLAQKAEKAHMMELNAGNFDRPSFLSNPNKNTQFTKAQSKLLALHADVKSHEILVLLLRLRQICCHPALINAMLDQEDLNNSGMVGENFSENDLLSKMNKITLEDTENDEDDKNEMEIGVDTEVTTNLLTSDNPVFEPQRVSSKMRAVLEMVKDILSKGDKLIIVSQWAAMLDVIASHLDLMKGASYEKFTGKVAIKDRQGIMDAFNDMSSDPKILLLSLTAGGVGLNLVGGNHLLLIDIHWNPQLESQAQDRIYRFGQKKNVFIYKFICKDTIEERIQNLQDKKLELAQMVLSGDRSTISSKLSLDDLKSLFSL